LENRVLRRIFGTKKDEIRGSWRKLPNNDKLHNLHPSPNITRMTKSRRMRGAEHVARIREVFVQSVGRKAYSKQFTKKS
jgi:hypothetical protein